MHMTMNNISDRRRIYLICRSIFKGHNAGIRKTNKVRAIVNKKPALKPLIKDIGAKALIDNIESLLTRRVFESERFAREEFPDLFEPELGPEPGVEAAAQSEQVASRPGEVDGSLVADSDLESGDGPNASTKPEGNPPDNVSAKSEAKEVDDAEPPAVATEDEVLVKPPPSLYPVYFPFVLQHMVLTKAQSLLEESCFEFAENVKPELLREKGWDCPIAGELTEWLKIFQADRTMDSHMSFSPSDTEEDLKKLLISVSKIRHSAVHRFPAADKELTQFLDWAAHFARILNDGGRASVLDSMRKHVRRHGLALKRRKDAYEKDLRSELLKIQRIRQELDQKEAGLIETTLRKDAESKMQLGNTLKGGLEDVYRRIKFPRPVTRTDGKVERESREIGKQDKESRPDKKDDKTSDTGKDILLDSLGAETIDAKNEQVAREETTEDGVARDMTEDTAEEGTVEETAEETAKRIVEEMGLERPEKTAAEAGEETAEQTAESNNEGVENEDGETRSDSAPAEPRSWYQSLFGWRR